MKNSRKSLFCLVLAVSLAMYSPCAQAGVFDFMQDVGTSVLKLFGANTWAQKNKTGAALVGAGVVTGFWAVAMFCVKKVKDYRKKKALEGDYINKIREEYKKFIDEKIYSEYSAGEAKNKLNSLWNQLLFYNAIEDLTSFKDASSKICDTFLTMSEGL